jgi:hypothetical protein
MILNCSKNGSEATAWKSDGFAGLGVSRFTEDGKMQRVDPVDFRHLYMGEFPPLPKIGDAVMLKGRVYLLKEIEPDGEKDRAIVRDAETGKERNVRLSLLLSI